LVLIARFIICRESPKLRHRSIKQPPFCKSESTVEAGQVMGPPG
jgi:hypothetical protein